MSRPPVPSPDYVPLLALVHRLNRELQQDMVRTANDRGNPELKPSHNSVFGTLDPHGSRASDMAAQAGITRQSMGEVIRELVELGMVEMKPDPADRRAKLVTWTAKGLAAGRSGYQHILEMEALFAQELGSEEFERLRGDLDRLYRLMITRRGG